MTPESPKRKLAAIMFTDMVGYTALMQKAELKARELVQNHREIIKPLIEKHAGEVIQYVGDGTFSTFGSAIEAVNCAIEIQRSLKDNEELSLRIGIHVGDVVVEGDEVYGDGVNVTSRLEPLAEPGGVCISERVYDDIKNQLDMETAFLGEKSLKNVDRPIKIYSLIGEGLKTAKPFEDEEKAVIESKEVDEPISKPASMKLLPLLAGAVVLLLLFFARGWFSGDSSISEVIAEENSLAVLFIENMTDPADTDRSAEMIRMLLSTDLAQSHSLRIIGSQRLYDIAKQERKGDGQLIDRSNASAVARKAGAQWMLTGTLAKVGNRMVLATEIENVKTGKVLDAQRADGNDLFSLVDALSSEIRSDMGVIASAREIDAPVKEITTYSAVAYQHYLGGLEFLNESNFSEAIERFERAVEIDPTFTKALYKLAWSQAWFESGSSISAKETINKILLKKESLPEGELLLVEGFEASLNGDDSTAIGIYQRLLLMYPDDKEIHYGLGEAYFHSGMGERLKALTAFEEAISLDPEFRLAYTHIFDIYQRERMDDRAIRVANRLISSSPDKASGYRHLADVYGWMGELDKSIENYKKAAEVDKGTYNSVLLQGWAYRIGGNYQPALNKYAELLKPDVPPIWQFRGKMISGFAYAEQGQYVKAIKMTREAVRIVRPIDEQHIPNSMRILADYYSSIGDTVMAFSIWDSALTMNPTIDIERYIYWQKGRLYAGNGNQEEVRKLIDTLNLPAKKIGVAWSWDIPIALEMELFLLKGNIERAMVEYDKLGILGRLFNLEIKANLYGDARDWKNVISIANEMQATFLFFVDFRSSNYPRAFYIRGKAYEEMGNLELAIENYEALLDLWKDADEEIPERRDTIKRLAALKQGS